MLGLLKPGKGPGQCYWPFHPLVPFRCFRTHLRLHQGKGTPKPEPPQCNPPRGHCQSLSPNLHLAKAVPQGTSKYLGEARTHYKFIAFQNYIF